MMKNRIGIIAAVALVAGLFWFGVINPDTAWMWTRHFFYRGKGAVSTMGSTQPTGNLYHARQCRENLHRIQTAKRKAGQDRGNPVGNVSWDEVLKVMYPQQNFRALPAGEINKLIPKCPGGGTYALNTLEAVPKCSLTGQQSISPEDDHIIRD